MIRAFKKWLAKAAYEGLSDNQARIEEVRTNKLHDMLSNNMAAMVAFKIDNGFIVRTMNPDKMIHGERLPGFVYCADAQAISEHIVTTEAKRKMGIQTDMFDKQQLLSQSYHAAMAQTRSTRI